MRPSYRFAAAFAAVVVFAAVTVAAMLWLVEPAPRAPAHVPLAVEKLPSPPAGTPSTETVEAMLDRVESAEVERFGEAEAARRRTTRQQLIEGRLKHEHPPADP